MLLACACHCTGVDGERLSMGSPVPRLPLRGSRRDGARGSGTARGGVRPRRHGHGDARPPNTHFFADQGGAFAQRPPHFFQRPWRTFVGGVDRRDSGTYCGDAARPGGRWRT